MIPHDYDHLKKRRSAAPVHQPDSHTLASPSKLTIQRAQSDPQKLTPTDVAALQRSMGNAAVANILGGSQSRTSAPVIQRKLQVGAADDRYEREADQIAQSVQDRSNAPTGPHPTVQVTNSPAKPVISRATAGIQRWFWNDRKRRQKNMSDNDLVSQEKGGGGTANRVDKVRYNRGIGKSKQKSGFFKPNTIENPGTRAQKEDVGMANRAVMSSRLDKWLGTNILSEEVWAQHQGENGSVSAKVKGSPLYENKFETQMPDDFDIDMVLDPSQYRNVDGTYYQNSGQHFNYHDFSNPKTQKGMSDLQLLDAITGQSDRHGGNIYIDPKTGKVKGIDNDLAFSKGETQMDVLNNKYHGLPSQVDAKTAKKILNKKAKNLPKVLRSKHGGSLSDKEIQDAQARLREVKSYLKGLKKDKKLVKKWDDSTYLKSYMENDRTDKWGNSQMEPSYTKRSINQYVGGSDRDLPPQEQASMQMTNNPLFEEQLLG